MWKQFATKKLTASSSPYPSEVATQKKLNQIHTAFGDVSPIFNAYLIREEEENKKYRIASYTNKTTALVQDLWNQIADAIDFSRVEIKAEPIWDLFLQKGIDYFFKNKILYSGYIEDPMSYVVVLPIFRGTNEPSDFEFMFVSSDMITDVQDTHIAFKTDNGKCIYAGKDFVTEFEFLQNTNNSDPNQMLYVGLPQGLSVSNEGKLVGTPTNPDVYWINNETLYPYHIGFDAFEQFIPDPLHYNKKTTIKLSVLKASFGFADDYVRNKSDLDIVNKYFNSIAIVKKMTCNGCNGTGKIKTKPCRVCNGEGKIAFLPLAGKIYDVNDLRFDAGDTSLKAEYQNPDASVLKIKMEIVEKAFNDFKDSLNINNPLLNISGTAKEVDNESKYCFLNVIANKCYKTLEKMIHVAAQIYYTANEYQNKKKEIAIVLPSDFRKRSASLVLEEIKESFGKINETALNALYGEFINLKYANDSKRLRMETFCLGYKPFYVIPDLESIFSRVPPSSAMIMSLWNDAYNRLSVTKPSLFNEDFDKINKEIYDTIEIIKKERGISNTEELG